MADIGLSFSPFGQNQTQQQGGQQQGSAANSVQDAIRILSLRQPTQVGALAPSPQSLMGGPTAMGGQANSATFLQNLLRMLFGGASGGPMGQPSPFGGMAGGMGMPSQGASGSGLTPNVDFSQLPKAPMPGPGPMPEPTPSTPSAPQMPQMIGRGPDLSGGGRRY